MTSITDERLEELGAERAITKRLSKDGTRMVVITRWLDRQMSPPKWRSKNHHVKLRPSEIEYCRQQAAEGATR